MDGERESVYWWACVYMSADVEEPTCNDVILC